MKIKPRILSFTPGEPAGIGPDLAVMIAQKNFPFCIAALADPDLLLERAELLKLPLKIREFDGQISYEGQLQVISHRCPAKARAGKLDVKNAHYVLETIKAAAVGCLENRFDALVTGPIQKSIINQAGIAFTGHTEYLAEHCMNAHPVMMLANDKLKVTLVTTHLPLHKVSQAINANILKKVINITHQDLIGKFGIQNPKIAICGLNPHAGEGGHIGDEEISIIEPTLDQLRETGLNLLGPLPADTAFTPQILSQVDVVIAMYHDQGLPVVKAIGFGETVNVTLGLPFIRTSVDHGTALSLAGGKDISTGSLLSAFNMAYQMVDATRQ